MIKVHVWPGISKRGPTMLLIFEGVMKANFYVTQILTNGLLPFIRETFPDGHRFQQDNNPKHTSRFAALSSKTTTSTSGRRHDFKHYLRSVIKPITKDELVEGISRFWDEKVDAAKCSKYIGHLQTFLPIVLARQGKALGH